MHEQPKVIDQINVLVVGVIPNVNDLHSAYKLLRHFSQMRYMSESKAILTSLTPDNIVWGGGGGDVRDGRLAFFFFFLKVSIVANILDSSLRIKCY